MEGLDTKAKVTARAKGELTSLPTLPVLLPVGWVAVATP